MDWDMDMDADTDKVRVHVRVQVISTTMFTVRSNFCHAYFKLPLQGHGHEPRQGHRHGH
jgi:hypothetical protein